jgi:hypothetical protein
MHCSPVRSRRRGWPCVGPQSTHLALDQCGFPGAQFTTSIQAPLDVRHSHQGKPTLNKGQEAFKRDVLVLSLHHPGYMTLSVIPS